uniref:Cytochrome c biogenesis protein CcsA n=1 Tax=Chlorotetraedron incus TaxID=162317 RepID=A0A140HAE3_9CHLO|nr:heme attachment to plastid cytochrome c [Chlorotetraedron incus]AMO01142.1 heme attachment to plastid cytochrome c [Chlorotetraedron incus]
MSYLKLENFFSNFSFLILFVSMIFYWIQTSFDFKNRNFGTLGMILANVSIFSLLVLRWQESGHFPLSNLYESFLFLSWNLTLFHLILERMALPSLQKFLGAITSPTALLTNVFATFCLPEDMQAPSPLVPALQSNWLMMHVTVMILSYAALICGSLLSIAFLILTFSNKNQDLSFVNSEDIHSKNKDINSAFSSLTNQNNQELILNNNTGIAGVLVDSKITNSNINLENQMPTKKRKLAEDLDNLSYRILGIGFPLLTIGILSGAVWANEAWGSYWSWDPKETWALLTWLVFAIYLHTRFTKGWQGKKPALIASLGFLTVWICFLGVNLLGEGLHSYGFMKMG